MKKINFKQLLGGGERIVIPMIQRDYAQGRNNVKTIRDKFIEAIHTALKDCALPRKSDSWQLDEKLLICADYEKEVPH